MRRCEDCGGFIKDEKEAVRITYGLTKSGVIPLLSSFSASLDAWFHLQCLVEIDRIEVHDHDPGKRFKRILEEA